MATAGESTLPLKRIDFIMADLKGPGFVSLLDRFLGAPGAALDPVSPEQAFLRDLGWLLNSEAPGDGAEDEVAWSVVEFGVRDRGVGSPVSQVNAYEIQRNVHNAIVAFEPRLDPDSLEVTADVARKQAGESNTIRLQIRGIFRLPSQVSVITLVTRLDLERGVARIEFKEH